MTDNNNSFSKMLTGVVPLKPNDNQYIKPSAQTTKINLQSNYHYNKKSFLDSDYHDLVKPEQQLSYKQCGVQPKTLKKLKQGKYLVEDELDLHGMTIAEAAQSVFEFLETASADQYRCVLIIHGKGGRISGSHSILKSKINSWLKEHNLVLAFCSAIGLHGGSGAVYVLLKKC